MIIQFFSIFFVFSLFPGEGIEVEPQSKKAKLASIENNATKGGQVFFCKICQEELHNNYIFNKDYHLRQAHKTCSMCKCKFKSPRAVSAHQAKKCLKGQS